MQVRIRGTLTYADRLTSDCFVQDPSGGIRVTLAYGQSPPTAGWKVEVSGMAAAGGPAPAIVEARIAVLGTERLPPSVSLSAGQLQDPAYQYERIAVTGVLRSVSSERTGLVALEIGAQGTTVWAKVPASEAVFDDGWVDAEVRASGVLAASINGSRGSAEPTLWVHAPEAIRIQHPATSPGALPISRIGDLLALGPGRLPAHRVRVRGVRYVPIQGGEALMDESGQILVGAAPSAGDAKVSVLDVAGFLAWEHGRPVLDRLSPISAVENGELAHAPALGSTLTTAAQVRDLPPGAATLAYPVHLRAVVTYFDAQNHLLFVQDRTDGIFVELSDKERASVRAGDDVEVTGVSTADFAPNVEKARLAIRGHPGLPEPVSEGLESAIRGREDCHWIELCGIVQRVTAGNSDVLLTLACGRDRFKAHVLAPLDSLASLVDAEVRLRGVCGALFNPKHQMLGIQLFVPGQECIRVLRQPPADPFSIAPTPVRDLMQFSRTTDFGHRVRLRATVTYANRSGSTWVRDSTGGVMLQDHKTDGLAAGDLVDVAGFPTIAGYSPALRGAQVKRLQSGAPPAAVPITSQDAMKGGFDGQLVQIEGKLVDRLQQPAEQVLTVASGGTIFNASLPYGGALQPLEPGSHLRLTGICAVEVEQIHDIILPRAFRLLLRSPADVAILRRPPWLTADRVVPILAAAVLLVLAALVWAALLRRRVRTQTRALRAQTLQLRAAHETTREALQKAREAESLDVDSKRIVELIARDEPVDLIVDHIAEAVSLHSDAAVCLVLIGSAQGLSVCAVPALPAGWQEILGRLEMRSISFSAEFREPKLFSDDPAWRRFIDAQPLARFKTFCAAPIVLGSSVVGAIAAFFRSQNSAADAQLGLWCNIAALALERRRLYDQLSYRAQHDTLTGLPNRALLYERLEVEIADASRSGGLLGLLYIDLDGFKTINDTYGHDAGDVVLREAARRMTHGVRRGDTVARIGGDEFVILLPRLTRREDAEQVAAKVATALREPVYDENRQRLSVTASVGIGIWPGDGDQADPLLRFADAQMYGAKKRRWYETGGDSAPGRPGRAFADTANSH